MGYHQAVVFLRVSGSKWCALMVSPQVVHTPVKVAGKQLCSHRRTTATAYRCKACKVHLRIKCFGAGHVE